MAFFRVKDLNGTVRKSTGTLQEFAKMGGVFALIYVVVLLVSSN